MAREPPQLLMRLFSYIVARDYGFAPNPFFGCCTLATCKPRIRAAAAVGDWVIGTGAKTKYDLAGWLIFAMRVEEILDFNGYWNDVRFFCKKPMLNGSLKQLYGDNIYRSEGSRWIQEDSHHSQPDGSPNLENIKRDTKADRLLVSRKFVYFGSGALPIPERFRRHRKGGNDLCCSTQGHKTFSSDIAEEFVRWLDTIGRWGLQGYPLEFSRHKRVTDPTLPRH